MPNLLVVNLMYMAPVWVSKLVDYAGCSGGKVDILGGNISFIVRQKVHMNVCLSLNGYRDRVV